MKNKKIEKRLKILLFIFVLTFSYNCLYAKGTLNINAVIEPYDRTKKYTHKESLLIDAGILNSQISLSEEIKLARVTVDMQTQQTEVTTPNDAPGIEGDFSGVYNLDLLRTAVTEIELGNKKAYRNGTVADMKLFIRNLNIEEKIVNTSNKVGNKYMFIAYPEELDNNVLDVQGLGRLRYSFDLYLEVTGAQTGDIIRKDVTTAKEGATATAIGRLQDIIELQFRSIQ